MSEKNYFLFAFVSLVDLYWAITKLGTIYIRLYKLVHYCKIAPAASYSTAVISLGKESFGGRFILLGMIVFVNKMWPNYSSSFFFCRRQEKEKKENPFYSSWSQMTLSFFPTFSSDIFRLNHFSLAFIFIHTLLKDHYPSTKISSALY